MAIFIALHLPPAFADIPRKKPAGGFRVASYYTFDVEVSGCFGHPGTVREVLGMSCVQHVMTRDVVTVSSHAALRDAAKLMADNRISGLVVMDNGKVVGIVSEADILKAGDMSLPVGDVMAKDVISVLPDVCVPDVAKVLAEHQIKRVPVIDDAGKLVGIVSRADVVRFMAES
jgi:CBS domain-containing protein